MTLGDYLARHFRQMPSDELDGPEIRHLASGGFSESCACPSCPAFLRQLARLRWFGLLHLKAIELLLCLNFAAEDFAVRMR